jgi:hypothetical protein
VPGASVDDGDAAAGEAGVDSEDAHPHSLPAGSDRRAQARGQPTGSSSARTSSDTSKLA